MSRLPASMDSLMDVKIPVTVPETQSLPDLVDYSDYDASLITRFPANMLV